ncbi:MAG TPA: cbb3-type cytochrome c oxidase N-terminal domain-containing protein [Kofleriaceae bacterium]|nr:cbb3-type cytochrome c oxidase N-terminal domain-containing protein [Kofleriaceae bacterium]
MATVKATTPDVIPADTEAADEGHLMHHAYDGIREYDNPLPGWWRMIFIGTIVFSVFYGLYFHVVRWGKSPDEKYAAALASYDGKREDREKAELANISESALAQKAGDGAILAHGKDVFAQRCASCHGPQAAGLIGPNLTDAYQKHGSTRVDIFKTVRAGVPGTAMLAWGDQLPPNDVLAAAVFVSTLRGTNLPGKPPEGAPVGPFAP